jgi:hypothetical protein
MGPDELGRKEWACGAAGISLAVLAYFFDYFVVRFGSPGW